MPPRAACYGARRLQAAIQRFLASPTAGWVAIAVALLLAAPSLTVGLAADDWLQLLVARGLHPFAGLPQSRLDLFSFAGHDPATIQPLVDAGMFPWWTDPAVKLAFWRPLASFTHLVDWTLWPGAPWAMHLHSLAWFGLALAAAAALYRRLIGGWTAGLATLLYALDDAHGPAVGWIANRNAMVAVAPCTDPVRARALTAAATEQMTAVLPGLTTTWGVSRPHSNPLDYGVAYREATIAMRVAARPGGGDSAVFDELGVTRLLLAPGDQPDLAEYVKEVLGPVLEYDRERSTPLIATLRAYLESDCSLNAAAQRLSVHHKTLRYRLNRIGELTRLDLRRHEDRFRADLALRILQVSFPV